MTNTTFDYVTKPLYATVGAGDALYAAVVEAITTARGRAGSASTDMGGQVERLREQFAKLPADLQSQATELRERLGLPELPKDLTELRAQLNRDELRKTADTYVKSARDYYGELTSRGEETVTRLRADERVGKVENYVSDAIAKLTELVGPKSESTATGPAPVVEPGE
jgi:heparin binding hemagglutinin HbhA